MPISVARDSNRIPCLLATLNTDGITVVPVSVNTDNRLSVSDGTTGSDHPTINSQKDANRISAIWGVSSVDGVTPVAIYCTSSGAVLVKST